MRPAPYHLACSAFLLLAAGLALLTGTRQDASAAAPDDPPAGVFECRWAGSPIRIDGRGDEPAWEAAQLLDGFAMPWLEGGMARPGASSRARLLWDRENLYFLAEMEDRDLFADVLEHDGRLWHGDVFELFFKPSAQHPGYYEFQVNAAGAQLDMFLPDQKSGGYDRHRSEGDFNMESRVRLQGTLNRRTDRDRRWLVEGRIPWIDFMRTGGRPAIDEEWRFALCRYDYSIDAPKPEASTTAPLTRPDFHQVDRYAAIRFAGPTRKTDRPFGLEQRIPLTTSTVIGSPDPPLPYRAARRYPNLKLSYPVMTVREPGSDRMLALVQQWPGGPSRVVRFRDDPAVSETETLLTLDRTAYDICFHPDFERNGYLYIGSKGPLAAKQPDRKMSITRYVLNRRAPYALDPASETVIIDWPSDGHDGGAMVFGRDGMFYITTGDGTSDSDTHIVGQEMTRLTAKVLRIDLEHPAPGRQYSVPKDNPFTGMAGAAPETWAFGLRNPWRMAVDEKTGRIWVGNNGQDLWETVHLLERGANYGWSVYEGSHPFYPERKLGPAPHVPPTIEHPHSEARSITGGLVYYGSRHPDLQGAYIYGDYSTGKIWGARHDGRRLTWHQELADTSLQITGFALNSSGEILIADNRGSGEGGFYTLEPSPRDLPPSSFPRTLSASGLFRSVRGHEVQPGLIPYSVNAQLWSDGAHKERFIALPGADPQIEVTASRGWNFPDGTVLVKSFALETEEGRPSSRRWIETRFLTRQQGEWTGYSYLWNDEQTEATLVDAKGADGVYRVRVPRSAREPDGIREQAWRYPSRAECMACHTRAANFVLGLTTLQMNRDHRYPRGVRDNQLRVLEKLRLLRVNYQEEARNMLRARAVARGLSEQEAASYVEKQSRFEGQRKPPQSGLLSQHPDRLPRLADPFDKSQPLTARARSYIHANCANCHVEAGGGNAQMELEFTTPAEKMRVIGVRPLHDRFDLPDPQLIAPGRPRSSVLLHRISNRTKGQMPPLATTRVDEQAIRLLRRWIEKLPPAP